MISGEERRGGDAGVKDEEETREGGGAAGQKSEDYKNLLYRQFKLRQRFILNQGPQEVQQEIYRVLQQKQGINFLNFHSHHKRPRVHQTSSKTSANFSNK